MELGLQRSVTGAQAASTWRMTGVLKPLIRPPDAVPTAEYWICPLLKHSMFNVQREDVLQQTDQAACAEQQVSVVWIAQPCTRPQAPRDPGQHSTSTSVMTAGNCAVGISDPESGACTMMTLTVIPPAGMPTHVIQAQRNDEYNALYTYNYRCSALGYLRLAMLGI